MEGIVIAFMVPTILFVLVVLPIWVTMHYRGKDKRMNSLSESEREELLLLTQQTERMQQRIESLETILDEQTPDWRRGEV